MLSPTPPYRARMDRSYTLPTVKALFAQAQACAFPKCGAPLVFEDRGLTTVVAEIAHIRSASPAGPRHDPAYTGDLDGPANLLLLCGTHHRPVDRHERAYTVEELLRWKSAQRAAAGAGTDITTEDARSYAALSDEEQKSITAVARLAQRVVRSCENAREAVEVVRRGHEQARLELFSQHPPTWEVDDVGNRTLMTPDGFRLPRIDQERWSGLVREAIDRHWPSVHAAVDALDEEAAVLRMRAPFLAPYARDISRAAWALPDAALDPVALERAQDTLDASLSALWATANGEAVPA